MVYLGMNIGEQGVEQDRACEFPGYDNVSEHDDGVGPSQTAFHSMGPDRGQLPGELPSPLVNAVVHTSNTKKIDVGPSASDITMRSRNG